MNYADTAEEILAVGQRFDRHRELVARSDRLLSTIEGLNLVAYGALRDGWSSESVRLTRELIRAINTLAIEVGLPARRLRDTRSALDVVFAIQARLFGTDEEEDSACDS